ncbi:hypothetical protein D3C71_599080 [compost metagenome]
MNLSSVIREQLAGANLKGERFREIVQRLLAYSIILRDEDRTEQMLYDDLRRIDSLVTEFFEAAGLTLHHDITNQYYRLYPPGAQVDGVEPDGFAPSPSLRTRLSPDFVAAALALRFIYQNKFNSGDIEPSGEALIGIEDLAATLQAQLKRPLPSSMGEKMALLGELRRHRLIRTSANFQIADEDALIAIRSTILTVVSNDALAAAMDSDGVIQVETNVEEEGDGQ